MPIAVPSKEQIQYQTSVLKLLTKLVQDAKVKKHGNAYTIYSVKDNKTVVCKVEDKRKGEIIPANQGVSVICFSSKLFFHPHFVKVSDFIDLLNDRAKQFENDRDIAEEVPNDLIGWLQYHSERS